MCKSIPGIRTPKNILGENSENKYFKEYIKVKLMWSIFKIFQNSHTCTNDIEL